MGKTIDEMIAMLPAEQQQEIYERTEKFISELTLSQKHMKVDDEDLSHVTCKNEMTRKRATLPLAIYDYLVSSKTLPEPAQSILLATPWVSWSKDGTEYVAVQIREDKDSDYAVEVFYDLYDIPSNDIRDEALRKDLQFPKIGEWVITTENCEQQKVMKASAFREYLFADAQPILNLRVNTSHIAAIDRATGVRCAVYRASVWDMTDPTILEVFLFQHQVKPDIYIRGRAIFDANAGNIGTDISSEVFLVILENRVVLIPSSSEFYRILQVVPMENDRSAHLSRLQLGHKYVSAPDQIYGNKLTVYALQYTEDARTHDRIMDWARQSKTSIHPFVDRDDPRIRRHLALVTPDNNIPEIIKFGDWICTQDNNRSFFVLSDNTFRTFFR